jgi:exosortase E/protease (VPEID-CTERM system)
LGLVAWGAGLLSEQSWRPLGYSTLTLVRFLLNLVYGNVVCQEEQFLVGTPEFQVQIAPECSGYEGMGLILAFLGIYFYCFQADHRFPATLSLLPVGVALMWLVNSIRIAALIALGSSVSVEIAEGGFHSLAGWVGLTAVFVGLVALARAAPIFSSRFSAHDTRPSRTGDIVSASAFLLPFLAVVATAMFTGAFSTGLDLLYPLRIVTAAAALWLSRQAYGKLTWSPSWQAAGIGVLVFGLWIALVPDRPGMDREMAERFDGLPLALAGFWLGCRVLGHVLIIPVVEELAFRGYLTRRLIAADFAQVPLGRFSWLSFLASSLCFGVLHTDWLAGILAGMAYALALYRRGRLADCILAHATTNALIAVCVLLTGRWSLWA